MEFKGEDHEKGCVLLKLTGTISSPLYFREPGGVLFELATDNPSFIRG